MNPWIQYYKNQTLGDVYLTQVGVEWWLNMGGVQFSLSFFTSSSNQNQAPRNGWACKKIV
jgi:hypothetical protein